MANNNSLDLQANDNAAAIRKYTRALIFFAPLSAKAPERITVLEDGKVVLAKVPEGYKSLGLIKKDAGIEFTADRDTSEVESLGYAAPTRTDITKETSSLTFTPHETTRLVQQLYYGLDLSEVTPNEATGEVRFSKPTLPKSMYYRFLIIGVDGAGDQEFFKGWFIPRGQITETESTAMSAEDEASYGMTLTATPDPDYNTAVEIIEGGSGFKANADRLGWADAPAAGGEGEDDGDNGNDQPAVKAQLASENTVASQKTVPAKG